MSAQYNFGSLPIQKPDQPYRYINVCWLPATHCCLSICIPSPHRIGDKGRRAACNSMWAAVVQSRWTGIHSSIPDTRQDCTLSATTRRILNSVWCPIQRVLPPLSISGQTGRSLKSHTCMFIVPMTRICRTAVQCYFHRYYCD